MDEEVPQIWSAFRGSPPVSYNGCRVRFVVCSIVPRDLSFYCPIHSSETAEAAPLYFPGTFHSAARLFPRAVYVHIWLQLASVSRQNRKTRVVRFFPPKRRSDERMWILMCRRVMNDERCLNSRQNETRMKKRTIYIQRLAITIYIFLNL